MIDSLRHIWHHTSIPINKIWDRKCIVDDARCLEMSIHILSIPTSYLKLLISIREIMKSLNDIHKLPYSRISYLSSQSPKCLSCCIGMLLGREDIVRVTRLSIETHSIPSLLWELCMHLSRVIFDREKNRIVLWWEDLVCYEEIVLDLVWITKDVGIEFLDDISLSWGGRWGDPSRIDHAIAEGWECDLVRISEYFIVRLKLGDECGWSHKYFLYYTISRKMYRKNTFFWKVFLWSCLYLSGSLKKKVTKLRKQSVIAVQSNIVPRVRSDSTSHLHHHRYR